MSENLSILPVDKTVVFFTPLEGDDTIVRTGTIGEGSCAYHSILHACNKEYASLSISDRMNYVKKFRDGLSKSISLDDWRSLGLVSKIPYQEVVSNVIDGFYDFVSTNVIKNRILVSVLRKMAIKNADVYKIVADIMPKDRLEKHIIPQVYEKTHDKSISDTNSQVIDEIRKHSDNRIGSSCSKEKREQMVRVMCSLFEYIFSESETVAYETYVRDMANVHENVDTFSFDVISNEVDRDIYFIDGSTRMPYNNCSTKENLKGRKSVVLLWVDKTHYEVIGRLMKGRRVQREFNADDPFIIKLKMFLLNPEDVPKSYPELVPYIPKDLRPKSNLRVVYNSSSESEDENMSDDSDE